MKIPLKIGIWETNAIVTKKTLKMPYIKWVNNSGSLAFKTYKIDEEFLNHLENHGLGVAFDNFKWRKGIN